jgi:phosphohistidine phosphatase
MTRHATAVNPHQSPTDFERELTPAGQTEARQLGGQLERLGWIPDRVLVSPATRTLQTLAGFLEALNVAPQPVADEVSGLYLGGMDSMLAEVASLPESCTTLMILGHNPGVSEAVTELSGQTLGLAPAHAALLEAGANGSWLDLFSGQTPMSFKQLVGPR